MRRLSSCLLLVLGLGCATPAAPRLDSPAPAPASGPVPLATGRGGAAATVDERATAAALDTLRSGGNAVDAAVTAAAVLGVTDPYSCGIAGGGFMVVWLADSKKVVTVDHRETAPQALRREHFYEGGAPLPFMELVTSGLSVGVPGNALGWHEALTRYGTRSLAQALQPAIRVAEQGFVVDSTFREQTANSVERFRDFTSSAALFLTPEGQPPAVGSVFKNPDLARTYRAVAEGGVGAFYQGPIAQALVDTVRRPPVAPGATRTVRPGVLTLEDLKRYQVLIRPPVVSQYRGYTLYGMGLPSSGSITLGLTLNLLEGFEPARLSRAELLHRYIEASRLAFADRNAFLADPAFVDAPVQGLLSPAYAAERRKALSLSQAPSQAAAPGNPLPFDSRDEETTHISVADAAGNVVSYTCTIEYEGGNGIVVPGHGFLLNNELTDFDVPADPSAPHPNAPAPGKRPRSSMSPLIVFKDGAPVLALGSPGGSTIITTVGQTLVNHLDSRMPLLEALAAPRVSQRNAPDGSSLAEEAFLASPEAARLQALGHRFTKTASIGAATAIQLHPDGSFTAAAEPVRRGGGSAAVVQPSGPR